MKQISNSIYLINMGAVNAYVIGDNGLTLIDTGLPGQTDKLFASIKKGGRNPVDLKRIILTHCHPDHTGNAAEIKRRLNIPVMAHTADATLIEQGIGGRQPMQLMPGIINWLVYNLFIKKAGNTIAPVKVDQLLHDNDLLPIAGGIQVIHTPGHTEGHICLLVKNENMLIAGDICANAAGLALSTLYEDKETGIKSIQKAVAFQFDKAVFGHGNVLEGGAAAKMGRSLGDFDKQVSQLQSAFKSSHSIHILTPRDIADVNKQTNFIHLHYA